MKKIDPAIFIDLIFIEPRVVVVLNNIDINIKAVDIIPINSITTGFVFHLLYNQNKDITIAIDCQIFI